MRTGINATLHSMENSSLNFYKFTLTNGTAFSEIYEHKGNLARYIEMFGNLLPGIIVLKSNFSLNGSLCGFRIFSGFSGKLVHKKFLHYLFPFLQLKFLDVRLD